MYMLQISYHLLLCLNSSWIILQPAFLIF